MKDPDFKKLDLFLYFIILEFYRGSQGEGFPLNIVISQKFRYILKLPR